MLESSPSALFVAGCMQKEDFTRLVDALYTPLFRFALSLTRNSPDACDLTQQTFLIWAKGGHALRDESKAKSWLFTTLYREYLRNRRQAGRVEALADLAPADADPPAPEADSFAGAKSGMIIEAMPEVDETYRVPLTLFYLKEFSYKEIADMLDVPIGTVMSRLARGKTQLRAVLASKQAGSSADPSRSPTSWSEEKKT